MQGMRINDEMTVAGQVTPEDLRQAASDGFKSVLNLRAPDEEGALPDERRHAEAAGLDYVNIPVKKDEINDDLATRVLAGIDDLPKPALIHCGTGMRAGAMAMMNVATRSGMSADAAMDKARSMGFDCDSEPQLKAFFEKYVDSHNAGSGGGGRGGTAA